MAANEPLTRSVWRMTLEGDTQYITRPGQFVNIEIEGLFLRRPISVCDYDEKTLTLIYKVVGEGTERMSRMACGTKLDLLTGLGNGFDTEVAALHPPAGGWRRRCAAAVQPGQVPALEGAEGLGGAGFQHGRRDLL